MATTLIHSVRIFDGENLLSTNGSVILSNNIISSVSRTTPTPLPTADVVIDGTDHTILPGLIDAHVHAHEGENELKQALKFGVTTVLDMASTPSHVQKVKKIVSERKDVADFRSACYGATVEGGWPAPVIMATMGDAGAAMIAEFPKLKTSDDAEEFVKSSVANGASYIKLFQEDGAAMKGDSLLPVPSPSLQAAVVSSAHRHSFITVAHALTQKSTFLALEAGTDGLAHCFCDESPTPELLSAYKKNNSFLVPTLVVAATLTGEELASSKEMVERRGVQGKVGKEGKDCFCGRMLMGKEECSVEYAYEVVRMLKAGGIDIVAGTDTATGLAGTAFGLSLHQELSLYVYRCGFTPLEALRSATSTGARRFGLRDRGRLAEGLRADVLLVRGDAMIDIGCAMDIEGVWRAGVRLEE